MEEKKKFEKPELQVVKLEKPLLGLASICGHSWCSGCQGNS